MIHYGTRRNLVAGQLWCAASIALATFSQLALKWAVIRLPPLSMAALPSLLNASFVFPLAMVGAGLSGYLLSMGSWFMVLRYLPLSYAYPMLSLSYVLVYVLAVLLPDLAESANLFKTLGVVCILFGVWLINGSGSQQDYE